MEMCTHSFTCQNACPWHCLYVLAVDRINLIAVNSMEHLEFGNAVVYYIDAEH